MDAHGSLGFRPTYVLRSPLEEHVLAGLLEQGFAGRARAAGPHILLRLPRSERRLWSPWLHIDIRAGEEPDAGSDLVCRFSPHPSLWTGVMLAELALLTVCFFAAFFAVGQHVAGQPAWAWWLAGGSFLVAAAIWAGSQLGQRLADQQMQGMLDEVEALAKSDASVTER